MTSLPLELIFQILTLSMSNYQPVDLEVLVSGDKGTIKFVDYLMLVGAEAQKEHQHDWVIANSVCHAWRHVGKKAFFTQKTFLIGPNFMKRLHTGRVKTLSAENRVLLFSHLRQLIVPIAGTLTCEWTAKRTQWHNLPHFHALAGLQSFHLLLLKGSQRYQAADLPDACEALLPDFFLCFLRCLHLDVERLNPMLLVATTELRTVNIKGWNLDCLARQESGYVKALPKLVFNYGPLKEYIISRFREEGLDTSLVE
ncbi:uncharacterized protein KY384_003457 [Bacidia gigantensis]|uniref:uncharacterized protein n=1 Tax=Bacidia gigantensis TaxID=2732470 RepID=UPI001D03E93E|nr:uncharacterized protein KY384_003457 [Bacidia gigantensis]KAG8531821.1 hypothetical protein KY384_003457 [Bacidia gigantensis]